MNTHGTPFPGKSQASKSKTKPKINEAPKTKSKEPPIRRQRRRIFGTIRNPIVPAKIDSEKSITKVPVGVSEKQPRLDQTTQSSTYVSTKAVEKKSPEKNRAKPRKKSVIFRENAGKFLEFPEKNRGEPGGKSEVFQENVGETAGKVWGIPEENRVDPKMESVIFQENLVETAAKVSEFPEENRAEPMKKSVIFQENVVENAGKISESPEENRAEPRKKTVVFQENVVETTGKISESSVKKRAEPRKKSVIFRENLVETVGKFSESPKNNRAKLKKKGEILCENVVETAEKVSESPEKNRVKPIKKGVIFGESVVETAQKISESPEKNRAKPTKKSVIFRENVVETEGKNGDTIGLRTPVRSPALIKPRSSSTPYKSAEKCSKCRFDRLETSSYWLAQIKLAESVGKHFVSANFFRLAFVSNAEPIGSLRVELKQYLKQHSHLSSETEWKDVSLSYGLLVKEESNAQEVDSGVEIADTSNASDTVYDEEQKDLEEVNYENIPIQKKLSSLSPEPLT